MLVLSTWVVGHPPRSTLTDHANLIASQSTSKGVLGTDPRPGPQGDGCRGPRLAGIPQPCQERKRMRVQGWGIGTHAQPSILSEEIVLEFTKFLSNPLLFFSHFLKVFQEFWPKRGAGRRGNGKKIELNLNCHKCNECATRWGLWTLGEAGMCKNCRGSWGSVEMHDFYALKHWQQLWLLLLVNSLGL